MKMNPEERWHPKPKEKTPILSRRTLIAGMAAAGLAAIAHLPKETERRDNQIRDELKKSKEGAPEHPLQFLEVEPKPKRVTLGRIAERTIRRNIDGNKVSTPLRLGGDAEEMTGISVLEKEVTIDPRRQLALQWRRKLEQRMRKPDGSYDSADLAAVKKLFLSFNPDNAHPITIEGYRASISESLRDTRASLNLSTITRLPQFAKFKTSQANLLSDLERRITPDMMLAYVLTELMPMIGKDAPLGLELLDEMLKHFGRDYVGLLPAKHDSVLSFGDYQSTRGQIQEAYTRNPETGAREEDFHGASIINKLLPKEKKIPSDLTDIRGDQHHVAAYLFAVYNLAMAVRLMGEERAKKMLEHTAELTPELVSEYIAVAHHKPVNARNALLTYTDAVLRSRAVKAERPDFLAHCKATGVDGYCAKTRGNLAMLRTYRA